MATSDELKALKEAIEYIKGQLSDLATAVYALLASAGAGATDPLAAFTRPPKGAPRVGLGNVMFGPDVPEALERARHCVTWAGTLAREGDDEDAVWAEIEKLRAGDWKTVRHYASLDPLFAVFALATGLIQVVSSAPGAAWVTEAQRESWAGTTVQSFLEDQFRITGGPGIG